MAGQAHIVGRMGQQPVVWRRRQSGEEERTTVFRLGRRDDSGASPRTYTVCTPRTVCPSHRQRERQGPLVALMLWVPQAGGGPRAVGTLGRTCGRKGRLATHLIVTHFRHLPHEGGNAGHYYGSNKGGKAEDGDGMPGPCKEKERHGLGA